MPFRVTACAIAGAVAFVSGLAAAVRAETVAEFYRGRTITVVVPAGPGGSYGQYGQLGGKALELHLPGKPTVVMQYMPGAGGAKSTNYIANVAPRDGSVLLSMSANAAQTQLLRPTGVHYDVGAFTMIGQFAPATSVLTVWHTAPAKTIESARTTEIVIGASGRGSQQYQFPALLNDLLGTKFKLIPGYKGASDLFIAMEKGEIHGFLGSTASLASRADWMQDGKLAYLIQVGTRKAKGFEAVPLIRDVTSDAEKRQILHLVSTGAVVGRTLVGPPAIPDERTKALRAAFNAGMADGTVIEMAERQKLPLDPTTGEELAQIIRDILATPKPVVDKVRALTETPAGGRTKKE